MQPCTAASELSGECLNSLTLYFVGNACLENNLNTLFFKTIYLQTLCTFREGEDRREEGGSRRALDPNQTKQTSLALISLQLPLPHPVYINKYSKLTKGQNQKCNQESATPSDNNVQNTPVSQNKPYLKNCLEKLQGFFYVRLFNFYHLIPYSRSCFDIY